MKAESTPNIALIKYWGNRNEELRLPAADSLSMTLDKPTVEVEGKLLNPTSSFAGKTPTFLVHTDYPLASHDLERMQKHYNFCRKNIHAALPESLSIDIRSHIPAGVGLASSAAVFSALAELYAAMLGAALTREQVSVLARLGSGSAARSVYGGFAALSAKSGAAYQIAESGHWPLTDIIVIPSMQQKKVGSTEGHALTATSPLFAARLREIPRRMRECIAAILKKDFEKLQKISEEDCDDMHAVMRSSTPSLDYLSPETHRIVREVKELRTREHLEVLYTMDAGPTVHLICTESSRKAVLDFAEAQKGCRVIVAGVGKGSHVYDRI